MTKIQVVLVDDHPLAREGLRNLLDKAIDIAVVGEADDGVEALRLVETLKPDVLVLDMEMPGLSGVEVAQRLKSANTPVRVLALSAHNDKEYIMGLLANGAAGYLVKEEMLQTIVEAVRGWLGANKAGSAVRFPPKYRRGRKKRKPPTSPPEKWRCWPWW